MSAKSVEQPEGLQLKMSLSKAKILSVSWEVFPRGMVSKGTGELPSQESGKAPACESFLVGPDKILKNSVLVMNLHSLRDASRSHKR